MSKVTFFDQACNQVEGFAAMGEHFMRQLGNERSMPGLNSKCQKVVWLQRKKRCTVLKICCSLISFNHFQWVHHQISNSLPNPEKLIPHYTNVSYSFFRFSSPCPTTGGTVSTTCPALRDIPAGAEKRCLIITGRFLFIIYQQTKFYNR